MTRLSVALGLLVLVLVAGTPFLYKAQRYRTYRNFRVVEEGVLYRSGQMTPAGFERTCRERGIRTVIKLREASSAKDEQTDAAEEAYCRANGIVFHRVLPKDWEVDANGQVPAAENLRWFEAAMDDPAQTPRPVLVHCFAGIHRTGAMVAAYRLKYHGWTNAEAVTEFIESGHSTSTFVGNQIPFLLTYKPGRAVGGADGGR